MSELFALVILLAGAGLIWVITTRNKFIRYAKQVDNASATIDVYFKKRFDLIPKLVDAANKYMEYELNALKTLTDIRVRAEHQSVVQADRTVSNALGEFMAVAEQYPMLKADTQFTNVTMALNEVESELAAARRAYNSSATIFNTLIAVFPNSLLAAGQKEYELFAATEQERRPVDLNFNVPR